MYPNGDPAEAEQIESTQIVCTECDCPWLDPRARWRAYVANEGMVEVGLFCPECVAREFVDNG